MVKVVLRCKKTGKPALFRRPVRRSPIPRASFAEAHSQILQFAPAAKDRDRLERVILQHTPTSASEAVGMLDVVIPEVDAGGRCDGLDVEALRAIRAWLSGGK